MQKAWFSLSILVLALLLIVSGCREEKKTELGLESLESIATIKEEIPNPKNLACQAGNNEVVLNWDKPDSEVATGYVIYRWVQGGTPTVLKELPSSITSFTDTSVLNDTTYFYLVVCRNSSNVACAVTAQVVAKPAAPPPPPPPTSLEEPANSASDSDSSETDLSEDQYTEPNPPANPPPNPPSNPDPPQDPPDGGCDDPGDGGGG